MFVFALEAFALSGCASISSSQDASTPELRATDRVRMNSELSEIKKWFLDGPVQNYLAYPRGSFGVGYFDRLIDQGVVSEKLEACNRIGSRYGVQLEREAVEISEIRQFLLDIVETKSRFESNSIFSDSVSESLPNTIPLAILDTGLTDIEGISDVLYKKNGFMGWNSGQNNSNLYTNHVHGKAMVSAARGVFEIYGSNPSFKILPYAVYTLGSLTPHFPNVVNTNYQGCERAIPLPTEKSKKHPLVLAIADAIQRGVKVINMSLGGDCDLELLKKIKTSEKTLFITSAGNEGVSLVEAKKYPALFPLENISIKNMLVVGSLDTNGQVSRVSNFGKGVDLYVEGFHERKIPIRAETTSLASATIAAAAYILSVEVPNASAQDIRRALLKVSRPTALVLPSGLKTTARVFKVKDGIAAARKEL